MLLPRVGQELAIAAFRMIVSTHAIVEIATDGRISHSPALRIARAPLEPFPQAERDARRVHWDGRELESMRVALLPERLELTIAEGTLLADDLPMFSAGSLLAVMHADGTI